MDMNIDIFGLDSSIDESIKEYLEDKKSSEE